MNNEPVAWMFQGAFDISTYVSVEKPNPDIYPNPTPLYTHPVKELTDEEILCLWDYWSGEIPAIDILDFADKYRRAILNEEGIIEWHQEYCKKMNEEDAKKVDTYKSQNNNQIDTYKYKNLTDAEITEVITKIANNNEYVYSLYEDFEGIEFSRVGIYELCKAILRKAQKK